MADRTRNTVEVALTAHSKEKENIRSPLSKGASGDTLE